MRTGFFGVCGATLVALVVLAPACAAPSSDGARAPDADSAVVRHVTSTPESYHDPLERAAFYGRGLVFFDPFPGDSGRREIVIREQPSVDARAVAWFVLEVPGDHSWRYEMATVEPGLSDNAVEYGYEEVGVPFDSVAADSAWLRALYAIGADGAARTGWLRLGPGLGRLVWRAWLPEHAQYMIDRDDIAWFDAPAGNRVEFPLAVKHEAPDYHFEPDSAAGDWLRVRVTTPSDACGQEATGIRKATLWVRVVDDVGRPLVWYYTRGC